MAVAYKNALRSAAVSRPSLVRAVPRCTVRVRASVEEPKVKEQEMMQQQPDILQKPEAQAELGTATTGGKFAILNPMNERINGRAAMLGFVAAVAVERFTHHTVFSQVAGRYQDAQLVERAYGNSDLTFFMIVALVTMASLAPRMLAGESPDKRSFGPFTPGLENTLGRTAMIGFAGLLVVEALKGSSFF